MVCHREGGSVSDSRRWWGVCVKRGGGIRGTVVVCVKRGGGGGMTWGGGGLRELVVCVKEWGWGGGSWLREMVVYV